MIEAGVVLRDLTLENPIRAIREISHDITGAARSSSPTGARPARWRSSASTTPRPTDFIDRRGGDATVKRVLDLWGRTLHAVETGDLASSTARSTGSSSTSSSSATAPSTTSPLSSPRVAQLDLAYHDINRDRGLYYLLERKGLVRAGHRRPRASSRPSPCRRRRRGPGCAASSSRKAQEKRRDFTVDWVHLKLNDQAQRTVLCKDPFRSVDDRVEKLIASM